MFGLQKYLDKIFKIKWIFDSSQKNDIESSLYAKFKKNNDHFLIQKIHYSYVDVLLGLEHMNFEIIKNGDGMSIKIM